MLGVLAQRSGRARRCGGTGACCSAGVLTQLERGRGLLRLLLVKVGFIVSVTSRPPPARAPRANRIWRACARPFPRQSMDMALAFCPPTEPFRAARRRAGPCGGHIAHGQALEGSVARYRSCHSVLIANVGSIRRVCHSNHVLNQTAARPTECMNMNVRRQTSRTLSSMYLLLGVLRLRRNGWG